MPAAGRGGVVGERGDAPGHRRGQFALALAVEAQRCVQDVDAFRRRPQPGEGVMHGRHRDGDGVDQGDTHAKG